MSDPASPSGRIHGGPSPRVMEGWVSLRDVLADAQRRLAAAGVASPEAEAALLAAHVLGVPRSRLILQDRVAPETRTAYERLLGRRTARVPLQHLLGTAPFRHIEVAVGPGVFVPRPETEMLAVPAREALRVVPAEERIAVDLCTGSGALAISIALEAGDTRMTAVELSATAAEWAQGNVDRHAPALELCGSQVRVVTTDAATCAEPEHPLHDLVGRVAVVTANPPYIPDGAVPRDPEVREHDPPIALYGGPDGLGVIRRLLPAAAALLRPGGLLVMEHADAQGEAAGDEGLPGLLRSLPEWGDVSDHLDLNRLPRYTVARRAH